MKHLLLLLCLLLLTSCAKPEEHSIAPFTGVISITTSPCDTAIFEEGKWSYYLHGSPVEAGEWDDLFALDLKRKVTVDSTDLPDPQDYGLLYDIPYNYISDLDKSANYLAAVLASGRKVKYAKITITSAEFALSENLRIFVTSDLLKIYYPDSK